MVNLLKEIVRRVTLIDILEQSKEADKYVQTIEDETERYCFSRDNLIKNAIRVTSRVIGDLHALIGIAYSSVAVSADPDNLYKYAAFGSLGMAGFYVLEHLYNQTIPPFIKKNDSK